MKASTLKIIDTIKVQGARNIGFSSDDEGTSWTELEISLAGIKDGKPVESEKMPFLKFKQLVKTADRRGIPLEADCGTGGESSCGSGSGTCGGSCGGQSVDVDSVIELARKLIKEEAQSYDPSFM